MLRRPNNVNPAQNAGKPCSKVQRSESNVRASWSEPSNVADWCPLSYGEKTPEISIAHSQMSLYLLRKKERLLSYGTELGYINTLVAVKRAPADSMDWWTNTPLATFPPLTVCPLLQQCLVTTGVLLRKARCCLQQQQAGLAGRTNRQDEQAGLAGSRSKRRLPAEPQTPADESQKLCCSNTNTRGGSAGLVTICPQIMRIF